jgi:hypothetical protein
MDGACKTRGFGGQKIDMGVPRFPPLFIYSVGE